MRTQGTQNKMAPAVAEDTQVVCPHCGQVSSPTRPCRETPGGFFCWSTGLHTNASHIIGPAPDPVKQLVEQDREVRKAQAELEAALIRYNQANAEWENVAQTNIANRNRLVRDKRDLMIDGQLIEIRPQGTTVADLARLDEQQNQAQMQRDYAFESVTKCRQRLELAKSRARQRLSRVTAA
jgi:hypothetical protein